MIYKNKLEDNNPIKYKYFIGFCIRFSFGISLIDFCVIIIFIINTIIYTIITIHEIDDSFAQYKGSDISA